MVAALIAFLTLGTEFRSLPQALKTLRTCNVFVIGPAGYSGDISEEEEALRVVLEDKKAEQHLQSFLKNKNLPTVLYGYLGLRWLDIGKFKRYEGEVRLKGDVQVQRGCIIGEEPAQDVWLRIKAGQYDKEKNWRT